MVEKILVYERDLFLALNGSDFAFLDRFMWIFTGKAIWLPLAFFILIVLLYKKNWRESLLVLLAIVLVITLCDQFASHLCKPIFTRFRPTHHPDFMNEIKVVYGYRGGLYGFISSHAANAFGFATLMSLIFRDRLLSWALFIWAIITAYTRIYLGVHFISDIIPGALSGVIFGYLVFKLYEITRTKWIFHTDPIQPAYSQKRARLIVYALCTTVLIIILFNQALVMYLR